MDSDIDIGIEANQGWKVKQAIQALNDIENLNIQYFEEPINRHNYFKLKKVGNNSRVRLMANEYLHNHYNPRKLITSGH